MRKPISPTFHAILDYAAVVLFAVAPTVFGLTGLAAVAAYIAAVAHLALTVVTRTGLGMFTIIPLRWHGLLELIVSLVLIVLGIAAFGAEATARSFFVLVGMLLFGIWILTDYQDHRTETAHPDAGQ